MAPAPAAASINCWNGSVADCCPFDDAAAAIAKSWWARLAGGGYWAAAGCLFFFVFVLGAASEGAEDGVS